MFKVKCCGKIIKVLFTKDLIPMGDDLASGLADFNAGTITLTVDGIGCHDVSFVFLHEYTHFFNQLTNPTMDKESIFDEEARASYVPSVVTTLLRENGIDIFERVYCAFYDAKEKLLTTAAKTKGD